MAKKLLGPWKVLYPVRFYSGGDTTSQAFGKHIQEIERIYGLLNALDAGKAGSADIADALQKHIDSTNPHPNWRPKINAGDIQGGIPIEKLIGNLPFDRISGDVPANRVVGDLTRAYIHASRVTDLKAFLRPFIEEIARTILQNAPKPPEPPSPFPIGHIIHLASLPYTLPSVGKWECFGLVSGKKEVNDDIRDFSYQKTITVKGGVTLTRSSFGFPSGPKYSVQHESYTLKRIS